MGRAAAAAGGAAAREDGRSGVGAGAYEGKVAKWWLPDEVLVVPELPHTATGKLLKTSLRTRFKNHYLGST